jgi:cysteine desulfurase
MTETIHLDRSINLDHNATTPLLAEVAAAMAECQAAGHGNPASQHHLGRRARQMLDEARETIGRLVGARMTGRQPDRVLFTSGGTEANNLAILGLTAAAGQPSQFPDSRLAHPLPASTDSTLDGLGELIISAIEHPSVLGPAEHLERLGWTVHRLGVSRGGVIDLAELQNLLTERTRLVSIMLGNNETGVLQPVDEAAALCNSAGAALHTDAVQVLGKLPFDFRELGVSAMSLSAHKLHGPVGIGALVLRHGVPLAPLLFGGFQQEVLRPGTESLVLAVGFRKALELYHAAAAARRQRLEELRDRLERGLTAGFPGLVVNGAESARLPHTANLAFRGLDRQALLMALDLAGIACSTGSACASGSSEPSHVLEAMGVDGEILSSSLRFSLGATTTREDIDEAVSRILAVCARLADSRTKRFL